MRYSLSSPLAVRNGLIQSLLAGGQQGEVAVLAYMLNSRERAPSASWSGQLSSRPKSCVKRVPCASLEVSCNMEADIANLRNLVLPLCSVILAQRSGNISEPTWT